MNLAGQVEKKTVNAIAQVKPWVLQRRGLELILKYLLLSALAVIMLLPLMWMVSSSLKLRSQIFAYPPEWIPNPLVWQNYLEAWTAYPFGTFAFNSVKVTTLSVLGQLLVCSMGGYGFARFEFPLKKILFTMLVAVMLVPSIVNIIPQYILFKEIGWLDTHWTLIVPMATASTFGTFLFRQFMLTIPMDLEDAARIDGANAFDIYWRIMLPLCKPAIAVLATFTFIASWNQFFEPLIFLSSTEQFTMTVGLAFFRNEVGVQWHLLMAASVISLLPTVIVFLFTQQYFVRGITLSGLKY